MLNIVLNFVNDYGKLCFSDIIFSCFAEFKEVYTE